MKKYWKEIVILVLVSVVIIPLIIAFLLSFQLICTDTSNEWIGFWGGYLGAIIGASATIGGVRMTLKEENKKRKEDNEIREKELIEKKRLEIMPYLTAYYYIPKKIDSFSAGEIFFVDFTNGFQVRNHFSEKYKDIIENKKKEYYILNYKIKNVGGGSAVGLYIKVNGDKVIWNGGLGSNSEVTLSLLFLSKDLQNKKVRIDFEYHDILNIGAYKQYEELEFYSENYRREINLKRNSFLSNPCRADNQG